MQNQGDLYEYHSYRAIDFVIGLLITLGASLLNALGLNITKLDFTRQEGLPASARKPDWKRPFWVLGLGLYIISQVIGSTLALNYLRAEYVAPLGSISLVFNFILFVPRLTVSELRESRTDPSTALFVSAYLLVGTPVTRLDILGTVIVVLGVVGVVVFGNNRLPSESFDREANLSLPVLKDIWSRHEWIIYLIFLEGATVFLFWFSTICHEVCMARIVDERGDASGNVDSAIDDMVGHGGGRRVSVPPTAWAQIKETASHSHGFARRFLKKHIERWSLARPDGIIRRAAGFSWSVTAGVLAGQSLVFAKSGVKLLATGFDNKTNDPNPFTSVLTYIILILLVGSAVSQVYCLNKALKCCDSTLSVPVLFATYTTCGFLNNLVYLDQLDSYKPWVFGMIWFSIVVLISGVVLLSLKKPESPRGRSESIAQQEEGTGSGPAEGIEMQNKKGENVVEVILGTGNTPVLKDGGKRQGSLGKVFGGRPEDSQEVVEVEGEASRKERRRGAQRLGDDDEGDSSAASRIRGRGELEPPQFDEVDVLEAKAFEEDDFGDFEHADEDDKKARR